MIVTLTPNPSVDRTIELVSLVRGAVNRATGGRVDAGGKGVNVSRALAGHGLKTTAVVPIGGPDGHVLAELLAGSGVDVRRVPVAGGVRVNITVAEPDGTTTKLNEPGPTLTAAEVAELSAAVLDVATPGSWVVCCGSLPGGVDPGFYAGLVAPLHAHGVQVAVDTSGPALAAALSAEGTAALPDLVKPNREELEEAVGHPLHTLGDVVGAARELRSRGVGVVLVSLGRDGAVLVGGGEAVHGSSQVARPLSTVGAGDAFLAGFLSQLPEGGPPIADLPPERQVAALAEALRWGGAATGLPGSRMPGPDDVAGIPVTLHEEIDQSRRLEA